MKSVGTRLTLLYLLITGGILAVFAGSLYLWIGERHGRMLDEDVLVRSVLFQERFLEEYEEGRRGIHPDLGPLLEDFMARRAPRGRSSRRTAAGCSSPRTTRRIFPAGAGTRGP